uniref:Bm547 n=1 Tax=Brugia malayi TaxID=6279 RepID=A0A0J9XXW2_BRUMA|nr:Bm547 [Brugia malayi]
MSHVLVPDRNIYFDLMSINVWILMNACILIGYKHTVKEKKENLQWKIIKSSINCAFHQQKLGSNFVINVI